MKKLVLFLGILALMFVVLPPHEADAALVPVRCADGTTVNYEPPATAEQACVSHGGVGYCPPAPPSGVNVNPPCSPTTAKGLLDILGKVFTVMLIFLVTIASFSLLYAAFLYVTSEGEQEKINTAKKIIIYAVIALIVAALALGAPRAIQAFITT